MPRKGILSFRRLSLRSAPLAALAVSLSLACHAFGQQSQPVGMVGKIDESDRVTLSGNVHPLARAKYDRGAVSPSEPADRMLLLLQRSPQREAALRAFLESLQDKNSPNFHKWLTPEEFGDQWGPAESDLAKVIAWLQSHGFTVAGPTPGRIAIEFSGTAGQIEEAFHTEIHTYMWNGATHHANDRDPSIPAALAPLVAGISTLNDFRPKALTRPGPRGIYNRVTHRARAVSSYSGPLASPDYTTSSSSGDFLYVGPADAATLYDAPNPALNANYAGSSITGWGAKIGIVGDSNLDLTENANYRDLFGLAHAPVTVIVDANRDPGENQDAVEAYLDTEVANGIAPNARVYFYTSAGTYVAYGLDLAILRAIDDNIVDILSVSFGSCEQSLGASGNAVFRNLWEQAAAQGISVTVATGDAGSAGCDDDNAESTAVDGLQVNGLASTVYDIAVGGTDFAALAGPDGGGADFTNYVSTGNASGTLASALGYIPEVPWNDSPANYPPTVYADNQEQAPAYQNIVAAGGGASNCAFSSVVDGVATCARGYDKPTWQSGSGVPADGARDLPDVALLAANGYYYATWGICTDQDYLTDGTPVTDCVLGADGLGPDEFYIYGAGGTSASAPAFAGILALVKSATGERLGQADYALYNLATADPAVFHDVTTGNNSVACAAGSPNCAENTAGYYFEQGFDAGTGYDLASGLGSVDIAALIQNWSATGLYPTVTTLTAAPTTLEHGTPVLVDATVTSADGIPTGDVGLIAEVNPVTEPNNSAVANFPLYPGGSTGTQTVNSLPGGSYSLVAHYGGSAAFAQSASVPVSLTVTPESSSVLLTITSYDPSSGAGTPATTINYGTILSLNAQPYGNRSSTIGGVLNPDGVATGTVGFSANGSFLSGGHIPADGIAEYNPPNPPLPKTYLFMAAYSGDASFDPSSAGKAVTILPAPVTLTLTSNTTLETGAPIQFTVTLATDSAGRAPTGTVSLYNQALGPGPGKAIAGIPISGVAGGASGLASGTAVFTTSDFTPNQNPIYAHYETDGAYADGNSNVIVIKGLATFSIAGASVNLPDQTATAAPQLATASLGGYAGTVNYTCVRTSQPATATGLAYCAMDPASETLSSGGTVYPLMLIYGFGTKLPKGITAGFNRSPANPANRRAWIPWGGSALAALFLLGIPARRRCRRAGIAAALLVACFAGLSSCARSHTRPISPGTYTFLVTGTDSVDATNTHSATVTLIVP